MHIKAFGTQVQCKAFESFRFKYSKENEKVILNGHCLEDVCECLNVR